MNLMKKLVPLLGGHHQLGLPGVRHYLAWRYPQVNPDLRFRGWMTPYDLPSALSSGSRPNYRRSEDSQ